MNIRDEIKQIDVSGKKLREFGLLVGGVFVALGIMFWWKQKPVYPYFLGVGGSLMVLGFLRSAWLKTVYFGWMALAVVLGWFVSRVLLTFLFYAVVTPIGLITRALGKDFLDLKFRDRESYWIKREQGLGAKEDCEKQF